MVPIITKKQNKPIFTNPSFFCCLFLLHRMFLLFVFLLSIAIAAAFNWIANTLVALFFPDINNALNNYSFLPFCGWLAIAFVFTVFMVPETKGKTPNELLRWFNKGYGGVASS